MWPILRNTPSGCFQQRDRQARGSGRPEEGPSERKRGREQDWTVRRRKDGDAVEPSRAHCLSLSGGCHRARYGQKVAPVFLRRGKNLPVPPPRSRAFDLRYARQPPQRQAGTEKQAFQPNRKTVAWEGVNASAIHHPSWHGEAFRKAFAGPGALTAAASYPRRL